MSEHEQSAGVSAVATVKPDQGMRPNSLDTNDQASQPDNDQKEADKGERVNVAGIPHRPYCRLCVSDAALWLCGCHDSKQDQQYAASDGSNAAQAAGRSPLEGP
jgi:hypothetical protein